MRRTPVVALVAVALLTAIGGAFLADAAGRGERVHRKSKVTANDRAIRDNALALIAEGREIFRRDTFGDEAFWGDALRLHEAVAGADLGGVGPGLSARAALELGLKVDADALKGGLRGKVRSGKIDLDAPATTLALLRADAVLGVTGFFAEDGTLESIGLQCAFCHSTVDNSLAFGVGRRLDGLANHDLNVGAIVALAPNLQPIADLLGTDVDTVRMVLNSWGPGKFDAELFLDGKAFNPEQRTNGVVTGTNVPGATLIPNALGLAGHNQHTWTGAWGTVSYWNAFVATLELRGVGRFFDPRLNDAQQFPIAAAHGFADLPHIPPEDDRVTSKLPALHFYQLAIPVPQPKPGVDFDPVAAEHGDELFSTTARCNDCHVEPLWTEPGWNLHPASDVGIDSFQADRAPDHAYRTMNLAGLFIRENGLFMRPENKGRFYHDGRFATLTDVVKHYRAFLGLPLSDEDVHDLVEYLKSLPSETGDDSD